MALLLLCIAALLVLPPDAHTWVLACTLVVVTFMKRPE